VIYLEKRDEFSGSLEVGNTELSLGRNIFESATTSDQD